MIKQYSYANDWQNYLSEHFQVGEFRSFDDEHGYLTTDVILIDDALIPMLENIYQALNCSSIIITSGYRSEDFDIRIGGFAGYHSKGQAVDIMCYNQQNEVISSVDVCITAQNLGVLGIGYGENYTHLDTRDWKSFFDETNGAVNIDDWYDYFGIPKPYVPTSDVNVEYCVKTLNYGWLPIVKNLEDYAGYNGDSITGVAIRVDKGSIKYRVRTINGYWLPYVTGFDLNDFNNGFAGDGNVIDCIEVYYYTPDDIRPYKRAKYSVNDYDWQYDDERINGQEGYAGIIGVPATTFKITIE